MKKKAKSIVSIQNVNAVQKEYVDAIEHDVEYSLIVDPTDKYNMSAEQKLFIEAYVQFKNINTAADVAGIEPSTAKSYFMAYSTQEEIRRINRALYHRQFASKMLTLDEIGGWLTAMLTDENVPLADRLRSQEKLRVAEMIVDINKMKVTAFENPAEFAANDIEADIKNLSVETIKQLLAQNNKTKEKNDAIARIDPDNKLSVEERAYLSTLPLKDLLEMIEEFNGGE